MEFQHLVHQQSQTVFINFVILSALLSFVLCMNIDQKILKPCDEFNKKNEEVNQGVNLDYNAVCTEKGYFAPLQCNVNSGKCWCVNNMGNALPGTAIYQRPYCGKELH